MTGAIGAGQSFRRSSLALLVVAAALALVGGLSLVVPDLRIALGPVRISATDPWRVLFQAAIVWAIATVLALPRRGSVVRTIVPIVAMLLAGAADSEPRRVGDGAEYVAMGLALGRWQAPALARAQLQQTEAAMRALPGFADTTLQQPLVGADGRQDFYHFWLYPLLAAPFVAVAGAIGAHVNHGFTALNLVLLLVLGGVLMQRRRDDLLFALALGPPLWWIDKAHGEMFLFVTIALAVLLLDTRPVLSLLIAGLATAQNPAAAIVLGGCVAVSAWRSPRTPALAAGVAGAILLAALAPIYYAWHLGTWSPLSATIVPAIPSLRALLTPLVDLNLGLFWYAPVLCALAVVGLLVGTRTYALSWLAIAAALMLVFALTPNVNHGGSPGISRYALWVLALMVAPASLACARLEARAPALLRGALIVSMILGVAAFRPTWPDRVGASPSGIAAAVWRAWPSLDNPLPEVFAERAGGRDGDAQVPATTGGCEKVLVRGDGADSWWPLPCVPQPAPPVCVARDALCYLNAGHFTLAPSQPTFLLLPLPPYAWNVRTVAHFSDLVRGLGAHARVTRPGQENGRIAAGTALSGVYLVEGDAGTAAWAIGAPGGAASSLILRLPRPATLERIDPVSLTPLGAVRTFERGRHVVAVTPAAWQLLLLKELR